MHPLRNLCEQLSGTGKAVDFKNGKDHPPVYNYKNVSGVSAARKCARKRQ